MQFSIAAYSELERTKRIDAEFFWPVYRDLNKVLSAKTVQPLTALCNVSDGNHMSVAHHFQDEKGIPYFRGQDINTDFFIENATPTFIPENIYALPYMKRSWFQNGDILLSIVGTIGSLSIVTEKIKKSTGSCKIAILRPKRKSSEYIATFLQSKYGQFQIKRNTRGAVQQGLLLEDMEQIKVYIPSEKLEKSICRDIQASIELNRSSTEMYRETQTLLLSELGLNDWQPKHRLTFVKNYSNTEQARRIDAEYYQPKYEEIEEAIKTYERGHTLIRDEFRQNKSTFKIDDEKLYHYVEIGSVNVANGEIIANKVLGKDLPANAKRVLKKGDVIVSKVRTYRGGITIVDENGYVGSGAFCVLDENGRIYKETLLAFLHSKPLLAWSLKPNTGTSYPVIVDDDILDLPLPILPEEKQIQIQQKVVESFRLRKQSKHLLECAKRAVEIAIEQDEQSAIQWLQNETQEAAG